MKPKVAVIGLDGASLTLIRPLVEQGVMPNLGELMQGGCSGILKSTTPPYTPPAWSSFYTGVNPGKHGIFGFTWFNPETGKRELSNSRVMGCKKLWQILNDHGLKTGLINLPLTYPPEAVDGYMVTGMMTPENSKNFTYPESIAADLGSMQEEYIVDLPVIPNVDAKNTDVVKILREVLRGRRAACLKLLDEQPCDFWMAVFVTPDRLQHVYWKYLDPSSGLYETSRAEQFRGEIIECYRALDDTIGDIVSMLGNECQIFVMSDHGFCNLKREFFLNNWLAQEGFLKVGTSSKLALRGGKILRSSLLSKFFASSMGAKVREQGISRAMDWPRTSAYSHEQGLFLNLKGREEKGIVSPGEEFTEIRQKIAERLRNFVDPETGNRIVDSVTFKEDIYQGDYLNVAPDLVPVMEDYACYLNNGLLETELLVDCSATPAGIHHPDGVLAAWGSNITRNQSIENAEIIDVAPTILHALGLPVPEHMDGKVLGDLFEPGFLERNPIKTGEATCDDREKSTEVYSQEEAEEIQKQLRGMGYLS